MNLLTHTLAAALKPFAATPIPPRVKLHWPINYAPVGATYADVVCARAALERFEREAREAAS